jgi:hypothetical protein
VRSRLVAANSWAMLRGWISAGIAVSMFTTASGASTCTAATTAARSSASTSTTRAAPDTGLPDRDSPTTS